MDTAQATAALQGISASLTTIGAELTEGFDEITVKLGELATGGTTPAQDELIQQITDKLAGVQGTAKKLADIVVQPTETPPPAP